MINVHILKPLYKTNGLHYITIRTEWLKKAAKRKEPVRVEVDNVGIFIVDPKKWILTGKKADQVFLNPDVPLPLTGNYIEKFPLEETIVAESESMGLTAALAKMDLPANWEETRRKLHDN